MYVLGINAYHGDVSAVLLRDGAVVAALEEERFTRIKHYAGFPTQSIQRCLEMAGIEGSDVSHVAISRDPKANLPQKALFALKKRPSVSLILDRLKNQRAVRDVEGPLAAALGVDRTALPPIHNVEHHPAHLASAFFCSPFEEAAVAAIDGFGDFVSTSMASGKGTKLEVLERVYFPHSLGMLYTAITQHLGFLHYGDEFKVMGLAPYGKPTRVDEVRQLVKLLPGGTFELELDYFRHWSDGVEMEWDEGYPTLGRVYADAICDILGPARGKDEEITEHHENLAHSLQVVYEEAAFHILNGLWERTKMDKLCLAGGCGMNSVANGKIRANTPFDEVYVQPAAGDNGTALGAALYVWHQELGHRRDFVMEHAYWGTEYPDADVAAILDAAVPGREDEDWRYTATIYATTEETIEATADLLADGNVIGWFQGRMEWGSRALGNRSIIADPSRADMRDLINLKIKFRERFRPFAPSILEEHLHDYFVGGAEDPFMQQVYPVSPDKREGLPAITHVDGSGRLQTVAASANPTYHALISAFEKRTGTPILLNTSFNENEPIVDTPEQAFACFHRTRMDAVVIGNTVVQRIPVEEAEAA
ncbi:MAG: carbamoyltransferase C-terminal domain-containing protein [Bacteroidota bacterium]